MERIELLSRESLSYSKGKEYKFYRTLVLKILSRMNKGLLTVTMPDGEIMTFGSESDSFRANIKVVNPVLFKKIFLFGDIGFGESYVDGDWETNSITDVIKWMILNVENNPAVSGSAAKFSPINLLTYANKLYKKINANTKNGSKKNISAHYDLNNDFFRLWYQYD